MLRQVRLALRTLGRTPVITAIALFSLALGIGANTAIFSLFNSIILRPLPVLEPDRLVALSANTPRVGNVTNNTAGPDVFSYPLLRGLQSGQTSLTGIAAHRAFSANLAYHNHTINTQALYVSGEFFPVLGLRPAAGRLLNPGDGGAPGAPAVAVLSHRYWTEHCHADPQVVNQVLIVNGVAFTIAGVAPEGFHGVTLGLWPSVYVPITMKSVLEPGWRGEENHLEHWVYLLGRLKPGVSRERAEQQLNGLYAGLLEREIPLLKGATAKTLDQVRQSRLSLLDGQRGQSGVLDAGELPLTMLLALAGFVLLIACANIANLLLARAANRTREMAIRLSLGATRRQLIAQLLTESVLLAIGGGAVGLLLSRWGLDALGAALPAEMLVWDATVDGRILAFTLAVAIVTGLLFGLFPALHGTKAELGAMMKDQAAQTTGSGTATRFRQVLVVGQVAVSLCLLVLAALFGRSLVNVMRADLGVRTGNITMFGVSPGLNRYSPERSLVFFERLQQEMRSIPGVSEVSLGMVTLLASSTWGRNVTVEGFDAGPDSDTWSAFNEIGPGYFRLLGVPLLAGREFDARDDAKSRAVVINEAFARKFQLGPNPLGRRMTMGEAKKGTPLDLEIVGLVKDARYSDVKEGALPQVYLPYQRDKNLGSASIYVASNVPPETIISAIRQRVAQLDPNLPLEDLRTLDEQVRANVAPDRTISILTMLFGGLATLLAVIGLYGVLAYNVERRTREIGIRQALGADAASVRWLVLGEVGRLVGLGVVIGIPLALALSRWTRSLLYRLADLDSLGTATVAALTLAAIAALAGALPARRAAAIDPMTALRHD